MKTVQKSVLIWYSPHQMYELVTAVPDYPKFLPWCHDARVCEQHPDGVTAEVGLTFAGLRQSFTTRNTHVPDQQVDIRLINGPFSQLDGQWRFLPVADPALQACKVELTLHYAFSNATLSKLIGPVFDRIANSLVDAFVKRAQQMYGG